MQKAIIYSGFPYSDWKDVPESIKTYIYSIIKESNITIKL
jgi:hypothetical protein